TYKPAAFIAEDKFTKENVIDIVKTFLDYKVKDNILIEAWNRIDTNREGLVDFYKMRNICEKVGMGLNDDEILDMLNLSLSGFELKGGKNKENITYEDFCRLY